jgi:hypothetical protein
MDVELRALTKKVDNINFPCDVRANLIADHDNRLQRMEDDIVEAKEHKSDRLVIWALVISAIAGWGGLILALLSIIAGV